MISVHLGNEEMYAIIASGSGKNITVNNIYTMPVSQGAIMNGVIVNEDALKADISKFWEENKLPRKDVNVVVKGKQITMKNVVLPLVKEKNAFDLVSMEFSNVEKNKPVFDYMILDEDKKTKKMNTLAVITEADFINSYISIFSELKIKLSCISNDIINIVKLFNNIDTELKGETALLQFLDGNNIVSIILSQGEYKYSQSTRIFSDRDTADFVSEVVNSISTIKQFYMSTYKEDINKVYLGGISDETLEKIGLSLSIYNTEAVRVPESNNINFKTNGSLSNYAMGIGAFVEAKKDINLFKRFSAEAIEKKTSFLPDTKLLAGAGVLVGFIVIASIFLLVRNHLLTKSLEECNAYINDAQNQKMVADSANVVAENERLEKNIQTIADQKAVIKTYPAFNTTVKNMIMATQDSVTSFKINRFDSNSGVVRIEATCGVANFNNAIVDKLNTTGLFENVDYTGYSFDENENVYKVNVNCILKESIGQ